MHLQDKYPEIYAELAATKQKQTNQPTLVQVVERGKKYESTSKWAKELDHAVAYIYMKSICIHGIYIYATCSS